MQNTSPSGLGYASPSLLTWAVRESSCGASALTADKDRSGYSPRSACLPKLGVHFKCCHCGGYTFSVFCMLEVILVNWTFMSYPTNCFIDDNSILALNFGKAEEARPFI